MRQQFAWLLALLLASGCSLVRPPDRDLIPRDAEAGVMDAGDAGPDASDAGDAGDAGDGGGCPMRERRETSCDNGEDDDCDGVIDCLDYDCRGIVECCVESSSTTVCLDGDADPTQRFNNLTGVGMADGCSATERLVDFSGAYGAIVTESCQPITFGMRFTAQFEIVTPCPSGPCSDQYAALAFGPTGTLLSGRYDSELRFVIGADRTARLERAGSPLGTTLSNLPTGATITLTVELQPGPSELGRDVLYLLADVAWDGGGGRLVDRDTPILPLDDIRCQVAGRSQPGLYAAIEGKGTNAVEVLGPIARVERACANPSQFERFGAPPDLTAVEACAPGNVGAPALAGYCYEDCSGSASFQWDLWVDGSDRPREDDAAAFIDFGVCGARAQTPGFPGTGAIDWEGRGAGTLLGAMMSSAREPTLLPDYDDGAGTRVETLGYAYAWRTTMGSDVHEIRGGELLRNPGAVPGPGTLLVSPSTATGCASVREPLLIANLAEATSGHRVDGGWLVFTCDRGLSGDTLGVVAVDDSFGAPMGAVQTDFLTGAIGPYASRGVFGAAGYTEANGAELTLRLWFLARDGAGEVTLAYAQGRGPLGALPPLEVYPANPILRGDSQDLGGSCDGACRLTGVSVIADPNAPARGGDNVFVVARSRMTSTDLLHELVPLLQPRPFD